MPAAASINPLDVLWGLILGVVQSTLPRALEAVSRVLLTTPDFTTSPPVLSITRQVLAVTDALLVLVLLAYGLLVMAHGTLQHRYSLKALMPRLALALVTCNASLAICGSLIHLTNALTAAVLDRGADSSTWVLMVDNANAASDLGVALYSLVLLATVVLAVFVVLLYIVRDVGLVVLTVGAPLALAAYALPMSDDIAQLWWRAYVGFLLMQVADALLVSLGATLLSNPAWLTGGPDALLGLLTFTAVLYAMVRLPALVYRWVFRHPVSKSPVIAKVRGAVGTARRVAAMAATLA